MGGREIEPSASAPLVLLQNLGYRAFLKRWLDHLGPFDYKQSWGKMELF